MDITKKLWKSPDGSFRSDDKRFCLQKTNIEQKVKEGLCMEDPGFVHTKAEKVMNVYPKLHS